MNSHSLEQTARALLAPGKGLLAADESLPTLETRFQLLGIESNRETRRAYREMLFGAPDCASFLSGVILFDETLRDTVSDGTPFPRFLENKGILPGIKVDAGAKEMALHRGEKITEGLDGLRERLSEYREMGARFAKWRAVVTLGEGLPSQACLEANAHALARYAALCQEADIVPIVEPEVLMDGAHPLEACADATERTLRATFTALASQGILLEGMLLKPNMVLPGKDAPQVNTDEVARHTLRVLLRAVPAAVPGIVFLSGGQPDRDATARLNAINVLSENAPWQLTFSFARALQDEAMKLWNGKPAQVTSAQHAFIQRLRLNSAARAGTYRAEMEESVGVSTS